MEDLTKILSVLDEPALHMLLQKAAKEAINVQDACNLSGVVYSFGRVMQLICEISNRINEGTDWKNHHPIVVMYTSKIASLSGAESATVFARAYEDCKVLTESTDRWT